MLVRVRGSFGRRLVAYFCVSLAFVLAAVLTGLGLGHSISRQSTPPATAAVTTKTAVLEDSAWLSESYWRKRRQKKLRNQSRFNPFASDFGAQSTQPRYGSGGGNYRTVCVRLCDGYYFPISFSTTRDRLGRDEQACRSRCTSEARLFYYRSSGGSPETMVDRRGNAYADLKTAFLYRTSYNKACQCRPDPWSNEARQRHALYATKDWQKQSRRLAKLEQRRARGGHRIAATGYQPSSSLFRTAPAGIYQPGVAAPSPYGLTTPNTIPGLPGATYGQPRMALGNKPRTVKRVRSRPRKVRRNRKQWRSNAFISED